MDKQKKTMHINLHGERVTDYEIVRAFYGIENDNDLVRYLFSTEAKRIRGEFPLLAAIKQSTTPVERAARLAEEAR